MSGSDSGFEGTESVTEDLDELLFSSGETTLGAFNEAVGAMEVEEVEVEVEEVEVEVAGAEAAASLLATSFVNVAFMSCLVKAGSLE